MDTLALVAMNTEIIKVTLFALFVTVPLILIGLAFLGAVKAHALKPLRPLDRRALRRPSLEWELGAARARRPHFGIGV
jgi:hypothetical protein